MTLVLFLLFLGFMFWAEFGHALWTYIVAAMVEAERQTHCRKEGL